MTNPESTKKPPSIGSGSRAGQRPLAIALTLACAAAAVLVRLIPYQLRPPNVAANGALSVFGGARAPIWIALPAQILSLVVSDKYKQCSE